MGRMSIWVEDYEQALKGKPKDAWVVNILDGMEVSIVHTSHPHGLISWGWTGPHKFVLMELNSRCSEETRKAALREAERFRKVAQETWPNGLPTSFSEYGDEEDYEDYGDGRVDRRGA
jgi:hypothetical protein